MRAEFMAKLFSNRRAIVLFLAIFAVTAGDLAAQGTDAPAPTVANENYKIGPGDIIDVVVNKNTELSRSGLRVGNKGTIQLAMLDSDVAAACLTERELADSIKEKYKKYLVNPFINVSVKEFNSNPVAVIGAVNSPGRFQLQRQIRLAELLTFVNGPSNAAGDTVEIIRDSGRPRCEGSNLVAPREGGEELVSLNLADAFKAEENANPLIFPGDIVRITQADQANAYIQGNIRSSAAISLKEPVTLSQAVAMAGGPTSGAQIDKIKIRRQVPGTLAREEIVVNLK
jgi:polysaccharide export outer membrane protein